MENLKEALKFQLKDEDDEFKLDIYLFHLKQLFLNEYADYDKHKLYIEVITEVLDERRGNRKKERVG
jgi:hypothetical protein